MIVFTFLEVHHSLLSRIILKSAVTKTHKYAPTINRTFKDLGLHYNCVIDPTRPYSPQDKALVEGAVKLVYQRIFYLLSKHTFFSLEALNNEMAVLLETYNNYQFSQSTNTRNKEFSALEKQSYSNSLLIDMRSKSIKQ